MNKEELINYLTESIADLTDERDYNEIAYKNGKGRSYWETKDENPGSMMNGWWDYTYIINVLENLKKRVIKEDFNYSWKKRNYEQ